MDILVVDDNAHNRLIIRLLLEDFANDNGLSPFLIDEADDGEKAYNLCKESFYNIIFMDIMMPRMDGIEATKLIKKINDFSMIIAISAIEDSDKKSLILSAGAEDYIAKPINSDIFLNRVRNYLTLAESRMHKKHSYDNVNLYTKEIYNRHTKFFINSEDSQAEFWEFFLLNARQKSDFLSDIVRSIISIVEKQKNSKQSAVYIEESENKQYFTLVGIKSLPSQVIKLILLKNGMKENSYLLTDDKVSFELSKSSQEAPLEEPAPVASSLPQREIVDSVTVSKKHESVELDGELYNELPQQSQNDFKTSTELEVFNYLDPEDLYELEDFVSKLSSLMLVVGNGDITREEVEEMYSYLDKIGSILSLYSEVFDISKALSELSSDMATHIEEFIQNSEALGPLCKAFSNDMSHWVEQTFHTGAPSVNFMNDTIVVNCQTIGGMLKMNDETPMDDDDFDDIFDF